MYNFFFDTIGLIGVLASKIVAVLSPLFIGLVLAYLLNPMMIWFEKRVKNRSLSLLLSYILVFLVLFGLLYGFIVLIIGALPKGGLSHTLTLVLEYFESAQGAITGFFKDWFNTGVAIDRRHLTDWLMGFFSFDSIVDMVSGFTGGLVSLFVGVVASIYLLKDKEFFLGLWGKFLSLILKQKSHGMVSEAADDINSVIATFLKGAFVDSLLVAFLSSIVLTVLKVRYAVIIGVIGGLLNIIPYFGPFFGMIPAFLVAFFTGGFTQAIMAVLGLFVVQQLDSNYIYPKIVGATTGLHPLFVLLSVSILGYFAGIVGMILAVPLAGILQVFITKWAYSRN